MCHHKSGNMNEQLRVHSALKDQSSDSSMQLIDSKPPKPQTLGIAVLSFRLCMYSHMHAHTHENVRKDNG